MPEYFTIFTGIVNCFPAFSMTFSHFLWVSIVNNSTILFSVRRVYNNRICCGMGESVLVDYSPLWDTMAQRNISQYYLLKHGIDNKTLDSLKKNKNITMYTLEKLCSVIGCTPNDVVRFTTAAE